MQNRYQENDCHRHTISLFTKQLVGLYGCFLRVISILSTFLPEKNLFLIQPHRFDRRRYAPPSRLEQDDRAIDSLQGSIVYQSAIVVDGRLTQRPRVLPSHGRSHWFKSSIAHTSPYVVGTWEATRKRTLHAVLTVTLSVTLRGNTRGRGQS